MERLKQGKTWMWIVGAAVVIGAIVVVSSRISGRRAQAAQAGTGETVTAFIGDLAATASASGKIQAQRKASLAPGVSGRVESIPVQVGDTVPAGAVLVQLETNALERAVANAQQSLRIQQANLAELQAGPTDADVASAEAQVASAQAQLDDLLAGPGEEEIAASEANVAAAQANIWSASAQVGQASAGASEAEIAAAREQVAVAQIQYNQAKQAHDKTLECFDGPNGDRICPLLGPAEEQARASLQEAEANLATAQAQLNVLLQPDENAISGAQAGVSAAASNRDAAQANLDQLLAGASEAQIASARAQLAQSRAQLDTLVAGPTPEQLERTEAQVEQARISLEEAQDNLEQATLTAPFAGVVTAINVAEGEVASGVAVELVDTSRLEVVLDVDEVDVGDLAVGQPARITLETWPDEEIESEIVAIAPQASGGAESALVTYAVHLSLAQTDLPIRIGMTANANLITANREGVLLVPNQAIIADREAGKYFVNLVQTDPAGEETVARVEVTIGLRDGQYTQIKSGLVEGDQVRIGSFEVPTQQFGGPGDGGPFGGGGD